MPTLLHRTTLILHGINTCIVLYFPGNRVFAKSDAFRPRQSLGGPSLESSTNPGAFADLEECGCYNEQNSSRMTSVEYCGRKGAWEAMMLTRPANRERAEACARVGLFIPLTDGSWPQLMEATLKQASGDIAEAASMYMDLVERQSGWGSAFLLGNLFAAADRGEAAVDAFTSAVVARPGNALTFLNAGNVFLIILGRPNEAKRAYITALRLLPSLDDARCNLQKLLAHESHNTSSFPAAFQCGDERAWRRSQRPAAGCARIPNLSALWSQNVVQGSANSEGFHTSEEVWMALAAEFGGHKEGEDCGCGWSVGRADGLAIQVQRALESMAFEEGARKMRCCLGQAHQAISGVQQQRREAGDKGTGADTSSRWVRFSPSAVEWRRQDSEGNVEAGRLSVATVAAFVSCIEHLAWWPEAQHRTWSQEELFGPAERLHGLLEALLRMSILDHVWTQHQASDRREDACESGGQPVDESELSGERAEAGTAVPVSALVSLFYPVSDAALLGIAMYHFERVRLGAAKALRSAVLPARGFVIEPVNGRVLRVGYLSADFAGNSIWREMMGVVQSHSKERVAVWCLPLMTASELRSENAQRARDNIRTVCEAKGRWLDVSAMGIAEASANINDAALHILIDVQGWSRGHALSLLATRPAPIQVSFKNFVGTLGAPRHVQWLLSDRIVTPVEYREHYAEALVLLPASFYAAGHHMLAPYNQPAQHSSDLHQRSQSERALLSEAGCPTLGETGLVFGGFSNLGKLRPGTLHAWFHILRAVPRSLLWLVREPPFQEASIRWLAEQAGLGSRLRWSDRVRAVDHMAVKSVAALYLDTWPFNGHSTAVEALWAGLPVLTLPVVRMAGRVGASVLLAARLGRVLIARSPQDYVDLAVAVGSRPGGLQWLTAARNDLARDRARRSLFDTRLWTLRAEVAMRSLWEVHLAASDGRPRHLAML